ncbi:hypothetical protein WJX74_007395 [Apatococcus lobatus]|uniref:Uncharacterized protein n=1 Tax=Apatococcus lobatus TaxID=904363 RepID=A0AAW1RTR3_9CHLO
MNGSSVSQAAAVALRQLQSQLAAAYAENAKLQEEQAAVRADARAEIDGRQAEIDAARAHSRDQAKQLSEMFAMLQEMKDALQSTADDNGRLHERLAAEARKQDGLQDELAKSRHVHEEAERRVRRAEGRAAEAETAVQRAESEAADLRTAASMASRKAEDRSAAAHHLRCQLEAVQADAEAGSSNYARQIWEMEARNRQLQEQLRESRSAQPEIAAAQERCRVLSRELEAQRRACADAESAKGQSETALTAMHKDLDIRTKAMQALEAESTTLKQTSDHHIKQLEQVQAAAHQAQAALADEKTQKSGLSRALRRAEHGLSRVLSLNQSLVEAFTGVRHEAQPASAAAHPILSPHPAPAQPPARLGQIAYTSPLPSCRIGSPKRARGSWNIHLDADAIGAHWQAATSDSMADEAPSPAHPVQGRAGDPGRHGQKTTRAGGRSRPRLCSARVLELSAPKRVPVSASAGVSGEHTCCHHHSTSGSCWQPQQHQPRSSKPAPQNSCHTNCWRQCCREATASGHGAARRAHRPPCSTSKSPKPSSKARHRTREQMQSVLMSLEDELGALDLQYADMLRRAQLSPEGLCLDSADDFEFEAHQEEVARATAQILDAMHRKGVQIQQLRDYCRLMGP